jgi:hypothetical protein
MPVDIRSKATIAERNRENASHPHYDTPKKARVREATSTLQSTGVYNGQHTKQAVFDRLDILKTQDYAILREKPDTDRTFPTSAPNYRGCRVEGVEGVEGEGGHRRPSLLPRATRLWRFTS